MKKIDILNFITDFRKLPNRIMSHQELVNHMGEANEPAMNTLLTELQQAKIVKATELNGEKAYQVISK
jgi:hypothetical protein